MKTSDWSGSILSGFSMFLAGGFWNWFFPINKNIWTSSYVLYTSGLGTLGLATCILIIDMWGYKKWTFLGRVYGANAITILCAGRSTDPGIL